MGALLCVVAPISGSVADFEVVATLTFVTTRNANAGATVLDVDSPPALKTGGAVGASFFPASGMLQGTRPGGAARMRGG